LGRGSALVQSELTENQNAVQHAQEDLKKMEAAQNNPAGGKLNNASTLGTLYISQNGLSNPSRNVVNNALVGSNFYSGPTTVNAGGMIQTAPAAAPPQSPALEAKRAMVVQEEEEEADTLLRYKKRLDLQSQPQAAAIQARKSYSPYGSAATQERIPQAAPVRPQNAQTAEQSDGSARSWYYRRRSLGEEGRPQQTPAEQEFAKRQSDGALGDALQKADAGNYTIAKPTYGAPSGGPATAQSQPSATGLASLDVELPRSGQVYRFTTPRGEVEITAWAISKKLSLRLYDLLLIASTLVLLVVGIVLLRLRFWSALLGPTGSTYVIWVGLLMVVFGVFPVVGGLAFVAAVAAKIARMAGRRRDRLQPAGPANP
jgi:hypothetical protein